MSPVASAANCCSASTRLRVSALSCRTSAAMVAADAPLDRSVLTCCTSACTTSRFAWTHCCSAGPSADPGAAVVSAPKMPCVWLNGPDVK